ncbi:hypothetical protein NDU88_003060 [Pleurodeles waltl]|uniref:Uncharacterized protein n=1 Tax=Pleurodeles waltl TaxID=8319 RepID=A0AAV7V0M3_PLEWA|nr:hypothetical protein NDU88_003060 [Pleurodeles waltl]
MLLTPCPCCLTPSNQCFPKVLVSFPSLPHSSSPPTYRFPAPFPARASVPGVATTLLLKRGGSSVGSPGPAVFGYSLGFLRSRLPRRHTRPDGGFHDTLLRVLSIRPVFRFHQLRVVPASAHDLLSGKRRNLSFNPRQFPRWRQPTNESAGLSISLQVKRGSVSTSKRIVWVGSEQPIPGTQFSFCLCHLLGQVPLPTSDQCQLMMRRRRRTDDDEQKGGDVLPHGSGPQRQVVPVLAWLG